MNYTEFINAALRGRSVNKAAKEMGMPQPTLSRYKLGENLPSPFYALILAREAGISEAEALRVLAMEDAERKGIVDRIKALFKRPHRALNRGFATA